MHEVGDAIERDEVILDVLAGGEVAAAAAELVGDARQLIHLGGGEQAAGDFAAHHLDAGLALSVDAVLQAEWTEVRVGNLPSQVGHCLGAEGFDFFANRFIVLILKLFPLRKGYLDGRCHNHLIQLGINHLNIYRDYPIWTLKRNSGRRGDGLQTSGREARADEALVAVSGINATMAVDDSEKRVGTGVVCGRRTGTGLFPSGSVG